MKKVLFVCYGSGPRADGGAGRTGAAIGWPGASASAGPHDGRTGGARRRPAAAAIQGFRRCGRRSGAVSRAGTGGCDGRGGRSG